MVDPSVFAVAGNRLARAVSAGRPHFALEQDACVRRQSGLFGKLWSIDLDQQGELLFNPVLTHAVTSA
ncbi:MAG: hypothetical protein ABTS16_09895 [Candidatus Accumulibacter phosphatis]|jgi:hypothetical protein|uniref:Uncharacterized protein n=1 Tax=Candidatus Accumulibacter contiguus TaxID=2954381 RepID=A0ABX1TD74_9PROT|nr:hypothetical protein [Candidatus Accumulibacter contiguus]